MKNKATIKDIAERAGVSIATVSMVLNGKPGTRVSPKTVDRVKKIAQELRYIPDRNAQLLKGRDSSMVGLVIPDIMNNYYPEMTKGILDEGAKSGYNVIVFNSNNQLKTEAFAVETMLSLKVAGAIICGVNESGEREDRLLRRLVQNGIQTVKVDRCEFGGSWPHVTIDNRQAAYEGTKYLYEMGHRRIALIGLKWDLNIITDRENGYRSAMRQLGLPVSEDMVYRVDLTDFMQAAHQVAQEIMERADRYTAVFVIPGDWLAIECIRYWKAHGLSIPGDLSVLGFDGTYMGEVTEPALTTIEQPKYVMGQEAFRLLEELLGEAEGPGRKSVVLGHRIVCRHSVGRIGSL